VREGPSGTVRPGVGQPGGCWWPITSVKAWFVDGSLTAAKAGQLLARRANRWCQVRAGMRVHGTTPLRPVEPFNLEEAPHRPAPAWPYDVPIYATAKVHRDHHIEVAKALHSIRGNLIAARVDVRADRALVRVSHRGAAVKVRPRQAPGGRVTDPADLPAEKTACAMRDLDHLCRLAAGHGPAFGAYTPTPTPAGPRRIARDPGHFATMRPNHRTD
jgi:hypothetical protein